MKLSEWEGDAGVAQAQLRVQCNTLARRSGSQDEAAAGDASSQGEAVASLQAEVRICLRRLAFFCDRLIEVAPCRGAQLSLLLGPSLASMYASEKRSAALRAGCGVILDSLSVA